MRIVLSTILLITAAVSAGGPLRAQSPRGSHLSPEENNCATCHGEAELWEGATLRLFISKESLAEDVHFRNGVNCHDCHGGDSSSFDVPAAHSSEVADTSSRILPFRSPLSSVREACIQCHEPQEVGLSDGVHGKAVIQRESDRQHQGASFTCETCHGEIKHRLFPGNDPRSPIFPGNEVKVCGGCHETALDAYGKSVHGHGLEHSGLLVTAVCSSCHGAHGIYPAKDERSKLHVTHATDTCAACHRFIEERLKESVHGGKNGPGGVGKKAPGGENQRTATCTDCHQGHDLPHPDSQRFRLRLSGRCGNCHTALSQQYSLSIHGELTALGYGPAAQCSDCHGSHEIFPIADPASLLTPANRLQTCRKCHPRAVSNFADFDPHSDYRDPKRSPVVHGVWLILMVLLFATFGFFGLHSAFWFVRSMVDVAKNGRPPGLVPNGPAYVRFGSFHRIAHSLMLVSFLGLALTGLPLKYSHYAWAQNVAYYLGGFDSTSLWHRIFGAMTFVFLIAYLLRSVYFYRTGQRHRRGLKVFFGPDSPLPTWRDITDFFKMLRWFSGLGPRPTFERWAYWEKFDFWGAAADIIIIGTTGMILWFPNLFCFFLPGITLNIAKVIHSTQALLATGFVFAIHFFNTHLRAEKFPADMSVMTGLVSEEEMEHERPDYLKRLREEGNLERLRATVPSRRILWLIRLAGFAALSIELALLTGMIVAGLGR